MLLANERAIGSVGKQGIVNTYVNVKTNQRFPADHGCETSFSWNDRKAEMFLRGKGWLNIKPKEWVGETIPDLPKDFTREQWVEYHNKYGVFCAQELLSCCDYMKPTEAYRMLNPPSNKDAWELHSEAFQGIFKYPLSYFTDLKTYVFANAYSFDILKFEDFLCKQHGYNKDSDEESIRDFVAKKFGENAALVLGVIDEKLMQIKTNMLQF